jgi:hypothetical protein
MKHDQGRESTKLASFGLRESSLFVVAALALSTVLIAPSVQAPLVSDDYSLTVEARTLVWGEGFDSLYRPLRNVTLRWIGSAWPVAHPVPYRVLMGIFFAALLWQFALLVYRVEGNRTAGWFALLLAAFYPRMQEPLYWFAVLQDLCVLAFGLAAIHFFLIHRERGGWAWMAASCLAITLALGFKETAAVLLPVLILADLRFSARRGEDPWRWKYYLPLCAVIILYVGVVFLDLRHDRGAGSLQRGVHGLRSLEGIGSNLVRSFLAIFWPWAPLASMWEMLTPLNVAASFGSAGLTCLALGGRRLTGMVAMTLGMGCALAPTVLFGPYVTDRYVLSAALLVLWVLSTGAARLFDSATLSYRYLVPALVLVYVWAGLDSLRTSQAVWKAAGGEADRVRRETEEVIRRTNRPATVWAVRIPAYWNGTRVPVLGNGLRGILLYNGLSEDSVVIENFDIAGQDGVQEFWSKLVNCPSAEASSARSGDALVLDLGARPVASKEAACAVPLAENFELVQPKAFLRRTP